MSSVCRDTIKLYQTITTTTLPFCFSSRCQKGTLTLVNKCNANKCLFFFALHIALRTKCLLAYSFAQCSIDATTVLKKTGTLFSIFYAFHLNVVFNLNFCFPWIRTTTKNWFSLYCNHFPWRRVFFPRNQCEMPGCPPHVGMMVVMVVQP